MFEEDDSDRQVRYVNAYEGGGEGLLASTVIAPHPAPSPRKNGERERTEYVERLITSHRNTP